MLLLLVGGFGGVAAALALTDRGLKVVLTDEFLWIGGQVTSRCLCVLDELYDPTGETIMNARYLAWSAGSLAFRGTAEHLLASTDVF